MLKFIFLLAGVGLFLSLWIVIPAPTFSLLIFSVGTPEISPIIIGLNLVILGLILVKFQPTYGYNICLSSALIALALSIIPLVQLSTVNAAFQLQMEHSLGKDYLQQIPPGSIARMRPKPLVLKDIWRGITLEEVRIQRELQYANPDGQALKLNLYQPLNPGINSPHPALITIYGGAWQRGSPSNNEAFSLYLAARGYSVIAIDYRHAPKHRFPTQLEDIQTALNYISDRAEEWAIDLQRVAIMGRSAGAQLATIAAYQNQLPIKFKALVNYYGPVDLVEGYRNLPTPDPIDTRRVLIDFLGGTPATELELYQQASPINYVRPDLPPSLLIYAGKDRIVQQNYGATLARKLQANNNRVTFLAIPWADHAFDTVFSGVSNQLALYYTERFLAWGLHHD